MDKWTGDNFENLNEGGEGMKYIDPIFSNHNNNLIKIQKQTSTKLRQTRSDKTKDVKFPTNQILYMKLKTMCKQASDLNKKRGEEPLTQTKFNTLLLRYGLNHLDIVDWETPYQDTKLYMHSNILELEYKKIGGPYGIAIGKGLSERRTVYCIIHAVVKWIERGHLLEEIIQ